MADKFDPKFGQVVAIGPFTAADLTTGAANQDLAMPGTATTVIQPHAGSVVGISLNAGTAQITSAAGGITASAHSASTEMANTPAPVLNTTNTSNSYAVARPGACTFSAGAKLGISVSGTTDMTPTNTIHVDAYLFVVYDPV